MYKEVVRPILDFTRHSEFMHVAVREGLHLAEQDPQALKFLEFIFAYQRKRFSDPKLNIEIDGIQYSNPLVVGAGWDKTGRALNALHGLGFGGVTVGTVLAWDQDGDLKPRQFANGGVGLNRLGFNNPGMNRVEKNLKVYGFSPNFVAIEQAKNPNAKLKVNQVPIGVSLGKNKEVKDSDTPFAHAIVAQRLYPYACWMEINVSSPNTPGLRNLQQKGLLTDIAQAVIATQEEMGGIIPTYVKIAPDNMTPQILNDVVDVVISNKLKGVIAANTTINQELKRRYGWGDQIGGLSGDDPDFENMSTGLISQIYQQVGNQITIIGVGGVHDVASAKRKIAAGASGLQIVTGLRGEGFSLPGKINHGLVRWVEQEQVSSIQRLVGSNHHRLK